ncbi:hypothetical protein FQZ97_528520 [compost metagenome]
MRQRGLALLRGARGGDQLQAEGARPLAGDQADPASGGVEQHEIARHQVFHRAAAGQQVAGRPALEHHRRAGLEGDRLRQPAQAHRRHQAHVAVGAGRKAGVGRPVPHPQVLHARADRLDHPGALHAELQRERQAIQPLALVDVEEIHPDGVVTDAHLARAGLADRNLDQAQRLRPAGLVDADGPASMQAHGWPPSASGAAGLPSTAAISSSTRASSMVAGTA